MKPSEGSGDRISGTVSGPVQGQVGIGKDIHQTQSVGSMTQEVTEAEMAELRQAFADLRTEVAAGAPAESRDAALERVGELEEAVTAEEPDLTTAQYVKRWFSKNLPGVAGSVAGILIHPVVGKLVQGAGEAAVAGLGGNADGR